MHMATIVSTKTELYTILQIEKDWVVLRAILSEYILKCPWPYGLYHPVFHMTID